MSHCQDMETSCHVLNPLLNGHCTCACPDCTAARYLGALGGMGAIRTIPTEQPPPTPGTGPAWWDLVIADMHARDDHGQVKYGQRLRAGNGRDNLRDLYEELLDGAVYIRGEIYKRDARTEIVVKALERCRRECPGCKGTGIEVVKAEGSRKTNSVCQTCGHIRAALAEYERLR